MTIFPRPFLAAVVPRCRWKRPYDSCDCYQSGGGGGREVTSQLSVEHWHAYLNDPTLADAILDRVLHAAHRVPLAGESQRKPEKTKS